jgi:hypothetical protein
MEDVDRIAQWNASGSRKKSIVAAGLRAGQLEVPEVWEVGGMGSCQNGTETADSRKCVGAPICPACIYLY